MIKIIIYREPRAFLTGFGSTKNYKKDTDSYVPSITSVKRTKTLISDIIKCNEFDYFCTFTFDPKKHDRYNENHCKIYLQRWLHKQRERTSPNLQYLVVPEQHKDGAFHFHALLKGFNGTLKDSGCSQNDRTIFNITSYRAGFSTAVKIDNHVAVANYVSKYITKDFCNTYNRRRFFCSTGLKRPVKTINSDVKLLPLFTRKISSFDNIDIYESILS